VQITARVGTSAAVTLLVPILSDANSSVASAAHAALASTSKLSIAQIPALSQVLRSGTSDGRYYATKVLARLSGQESSAALIPTLADPNSSVAQSAHAALASRGFDEANIEALGKVLATSSSDGRYYAAQLLGSGSGGAASGPGQKALKLLTARLAVESSGSVQSQIESSIRSIKARG
jgi:HEAT repeat protein